MLADVIHQTNFQNAAGQISRNWDYENPAKTVKNYTRSILGGGIRVVGSTERFDTDYEDVEYAKMRVPYPISKRARISNIRDEISGNLIWKRVDQDGNEYPIIFDVLGVAPVIDPFGEIVEYEVLIKGVQDE